MPKMGPKEMEHWQKELTFANHIWEERGWTKTMDRATNPDGELWDYLRAYRGDQWRTTGMANTPAHDLVTTPLFFSTRNRWEAGLLARSPRAQALPRNRDAAEAARKVEALINYDIYEQKHKRQLNRVLSDSWSAPAGILRHGFTPMAEKVLPSGEVIEPYHSANPDKPWIRRVKWWDFRSDAFAETIDSDGDGRFCFFRSFMTMDQIKKTDGMIMRADLRPTKRVNVSLVLPDGSPTRPSPTEIEAVEIWSVYDKTEEKWFQIVEGLDKPVRDPDDWPIPWDGLPYDALYFNESMDDFAPEPYARQVFSTCVERNRVRTIMQSLVKSLRRLMFVNEEQLTEDGKRLLADTGLIEALTTSGDPRSVMAQAQVGGFDSSLLALDNLFVQDVREAVGQSAMDRGQRINVESGTEAAGVQQGSQVTEGRDQESMETFLSGYIRKYTQARRFTMDEEELVPILGRQDASSFLNDPDGSLMKVSKRELHAEYDMQVRAGSSLPASRQSEVQSVAGDIAFYRSNQDVVGDMVNWPAKFQQYAEARGLDPNREFMTVQAANQQRQQQTPIDQARELEQGAPDLPGVLSLLNGAGDGAA